MAYLITCPNCGPRDVHEYRHGGEISALSKRKGASASDEELALYFYFRKNVYGDQKEWWFHTYGCKKWFQAIRNTATNKVHETFWPEKRPWQ